MVFCFCPFVAVGTLPRVGITPAQLDQMKARMAAPRQRRRASAVTGSSTRRPSPTHTRILGIDPSLRGTGYGLIRLERAEPHLISAGTIKCPPAWDRSRCLVKISQALRDVVQADPPTICVVEGLFYAQNLQTAIIMGEARGAALAAVAQFGIEIVEIATRKVKQAMVGYGAAQKLAVAKMVQRRLNLDAVPEPDAADALALALTLAQEQGRHTLHPPKRI